ncbi:transposase DNA-binding-containing protein [Mesorhizobium sp.]|uniref:IS4/Tn5 family transposase DNA-binding protein n=1 Tax=Mesorhizobium sp. TaxID=1871066 RepID=UPI00338F875B
MGGLGVARLLRQGPQEEELSAAAPPDKRLARRLQRLLDQMSSAPGKPIPAACGDWAAAKRPTTFSTIRV